MSEQNKQAGRKIKLTSENKELLAKTEYNKGIIETASKKADKPKDGVFVDTSLVPRVLAQFSSMGPKMNRKAVKLAQMCVYAVENGKKRFLTMPEASAYVRSGYTVAPK